MTHPILYSFRRCPYAMRARLALVYSQIQVELREVVLKDKPAELTELSPKGTVPVLLALDNTLLEESLDIMQWALEQHDPDGWWQTLSQEQQKQSQTLIDYNDGEFKHYLDHYKYAVHHPEYSQEHYRQQAEKYLQTLEQQLQQNGYLIENRITYADITTLPFIRQFAFADKNWFDQSSYPLIQAWLNKFIDSELFISIMPKFKQWQAGNEVTLFP